MKYSHTIKERKEAEHVIIRVAGYLFAEMSHIKQLIVYSSCKCDICAGEMVDNMVVDYYTCKLYMLRSSNVYDSYEVCSLSCILKSHGPIKLNRSLMGRKNII